MRTIASNEGNVLINTPGVDKQTGYLLKLKTSEDGNGEYVS